MPIAFRAEASNTFPPSASVNFGEAFGVVVELALAVSWCVNASLEVAADKAVPEVVDEVVDARLVSPDGLSSSTTLAVFARSMVRVGPVTAADTGTPDGPVIEVEKIK